MPQDAISSKGSERRTSAVWLVSLTEASLSSFPIFTLISLTIADDRAKNEIAMINRAIIISTRENPLFFATVLIIPNTFSYPVETYADALFRGVAEIRILYDNTH
jgi:hypothetical protein